MSPLVWALLLSVVGLALVVLEIFLPSGGVVGLISITAVIAAIVMAFRHSEYAGLGFMAAAVLGAPLVASLAFKLWPRTPLGRRLLLQAPEGNDVLPEDDLRRRTRELIGRRGTAKTLMLPGGPVTIDGRTYDAASEGPAVQAGETVVVVDVRGTRLVVRSAGAEISKTRAPDDPLGRSIESLGLDPYDDPLK